MKYQNTSIANVKTGEAIVVAELNGQILSGNKEAIELYNYPSLKAFKEKSLKDLMPEDFAALYPEEMTPEHINFDGYYTHVCKKNNGELFACKLHTHYQNFQGKKLLIGHVQEIHEHVDIEKIRLEQIIIVLERELKAERAKNFNNNYIQIIKQFSRCYPMLSNNDLKVCYYLTLNYNSKQISQQLNITTDGVYAARKRIRKKLKLRPDQDLVKFLSNCVRSC
ncbi:PAS domain S-box protein [Carboxylicivirga sp. RSCT41]|uniref:PAS domain S-box protein n=1 Tax=Carboxylicivirga agarovorans TaxID=3417570 RepID=UPI003D3450B3